ncbi:MAG: glycosyltransferase family 2 protein [Rhodospirillales bacterium]|nr:glycosyltransferase family 2 protein [Rhodospirillales bacterium]
MADKKLISFVIPVFNEQENIEPFLDTLNAETAGLSDRYDFEILFTDNHSTDDTFKMLNARAEKDKRIRVIRFSRNFGYQRSILTAYANARGDAAIQLDCDLQDPPSLVGEFLRLWEEGNAVVYGIRKTRKEGWLLHTARRAFYRLVDALADIDLPHHAGDFRLVDRKILDLITASQDRNPYLRGMIARCGFKQVGVPYDRESRQRGISKFSPGEYFSIAFDGIVSQSVIPLRLATYTGLIVAMVTFAAVLVYFLGHAMFGATWPPGFATQTMLILFGISVNALFLGIIGEYVARIYQQSVKGPVTIVEQVVPRKDRSGVKMPGNDG